MELELRHIPFEASNWDVKRAFGVALHSDEFYNASDPKARPINFEVQLNKSHGVQNNGTGILILPDRGVGQKLVKLCRQKELVVKVNGKKVLFHISGTRPSRKKTETLDKTPYLPPEIEEEREQIIAKLNVALHVDKVQFGVFYRDFTDPPGASRRFSTEYELSHKDRSAGLLEIEYAYKVIRIKLGDPLTGQDAHNIAIKFANIRKLATGIDFGNPFICFELLTPPIFQEEPMNRTTTGDDFQDNRKYRIRVSGLDAKHEAIAPYAHQLRVILYRQSDIEEFVRLCAIAGIPIPFKAKIEGNSNGFYSSKNLFRLGRELRQFDWSVAFQIEALLHNGLMNTEDLLEYFLGPIKALCKRQPRAASEILRMFTEALRTRDPREPLMDCFKQVCDREVPDIPRLSSAGLFRCHHVTVTPTRLVLQGPFVIQSNRVIRKYEGYEENFIRVDFRDEDRLHYRWERDTDGARLLHNRVGGLLKGGFELAGRDFEFLAYSSSALREHAVWFVHPFEHPKYGLVNAASIRASLGDFSKVIRQPSKYAARMAQAFTATDPSVEITLDHWEEVQDLKCPPYLFTDGVGTISEELGDMIWDALCASRDENYSLNVKPSAYQIRFLGYKGVVCIDRQLKGVKMRLRESMNKFTGAIEETANIEIARAFERPNYCALNRPLIMVLEDRGVSKKAFLKLQERAVAKIHMSSDTIVDARKLFREQSLGGSYRLAYILQCLKALDFGMKNERSAWKMDDPFFERLLQYAKNHVLRNIKHGARIPVEGSYLLVGVADEGPAYIAEGHTNIYVLPEGHIFACVQSSADEEPIYLEGSVSISRSPVVHPGDVQRVRAIGKPPEGALCLFGHLKNCVVLPSVGPRSLASMLGGGDLDGDLYAIITDDSLLPTEMVDAANYEGLGTKEIDRESTIDDICDFVVEYINSDVLGLLSDRHLIIADQSKEGTLDKECMKLAQLCSQAVDYPKNGIPVDIHDSPRWLIPFKPDWKKPEHNAPFQSDYYESDRALGELFRNVELLNIPEKYEINRNARATPLSDPISQALKPLIESMLGAQGFRHSDRDVSEAEALFRRYVDELRYICLTQALSDSPDSRLLEEEVVTGTILAFCSENRFRTDRMFRMRMNSSVLVSNVRSKLCEWKEELTEGELRFGLVNAWRAWDFAMRNRTAFGANSFAIIALGIIFDILRATGCLEVKRDMKAAQTADSDDEGGDDE